MTVLLCICLSDNVADIMAEQGNHSVHPIFTGNTALTNVLTSQNFLSD